MADVVDLKEFQARVDDIHFRKAMMLLNTMDSDLLAEAMRQIERLSQKKKLTPESRP